MPVALGLVSLAIQKNSIAMVDGFMAMAGAGAGLTFGPTSIQARCSQSPERVAAVEGLQLFFRTLGGTIGLAQCFTVMNSKVTSGITDLIRTGILSISDFPNAQSAQSGSASGIVSIQQIEALPPQAVEAVRDIYRNAVRWAFISLIPWVGLTAIASLFLSNITDLDAERKRQENEEARKLRKELIENGDEYAILGPEPKYEVFTGGIGFVVYLVRLKWWQKKKAYIDRRRGAEANF